jgi:hypothetical protein
MPIDANQTVLPVFAAGDDVRFRKHESAHWSIGKVVAVIAESSAYRINDGRNYHVPFGLVAPAKATGFRQRRGRP